jgi:hypothetical protein
MIDPTGPNTEEFVEDLDELNEIIPTSFSITSYGVDGDSLMVDYQTVS